MASHHRPVTIVWDGWCSVSYAVWKHSLTDQAKKEFVRKMEIEEVRRDERT